MADGEWQGKVAVITGAAGGIGLGLARRAVARGMRVVLSDVRAEDLEREAATLGAAAVVANVAEPGDVERLAEESYRRFGQVDLLFNNAGVLSAGYCWEISAAAWRRELGINVEGVVNMLRAFVPRLLAAGRPARIVNTASVGGFSSGPLMAPYSASKFAVAALTDALYGELRLLEAPIEVSLLAPGPVQTGIFDNPFTGGSAPAAERFMDELRDFTRDEGLSPDALAEDAFVGIERGDYWLFSSPDMLDAMVRRRADMILERRPPVPRQSDNG